MKDKIKKWYDNFMIDPIYNTFMYILCTILFVMLIMIYILCFLELIILF